MFIINSNVKYIIGKLISNVFLPKRWMCIFWQKQTSPLKYSTLSFCSVKNNNFSLLVKLLQDVPAVGMCGQWKHEKVPIIPGMRWRWWRLDGSLLSRTDFSWLDPLFSVCRKWWRGPRPPALSRSVSHTSSLARLLACACVCMCVCVWHYRARSTYSSANNHITQGKIHSNPPPPPPQNLQFVRWSHVGTADREEEGGGWGGLAEVQTEASESRWRRTTCFALMGFHFTCCLRGRVFLHRLRPRSPLPAWLEANWPSFQIT